MTDSLLAAANQLAGVSRFLLMLPLCMSVALIYKVTRIDNLRKALTAAMVLWVEIVVGMVVLGVGLWLLFRIMA